MILGCSFSCPLHPVRNKTNKITAKVFIIFSSGYQILILPSASIAPTPIGIIFFMVATDIVIMVISNTLIPVPS